jgi:GDPmannose 4,6-dehydratase
MRKRALITGITGQDGSYLAEFLLGKGYHVYGIIRRSSSFNTARLDSIYQDPHVPANRLTLIYGDLNDASSINHILRKVRPHEIYNLAAQSHVKVSFEIPEYTSEVTALGALRILEALRETKVRARFYQASSSEIFGRAKAPQSESTALEPVSPYGVSKLFAYWTTRNYREGYGMFACNGILFNHETVASFMPMFCKKTGEQDFDIKPICQIISFDESLRQYQSQKVSGIRVWGKEGWVEVTYASAYPHDITGDNKKPRFINSRSGAFMATSSHVGFMEGEEEKEVGNMVIGDHLETIDLPTPGSQNNRHITEEEAELLGMLVGDGSISYEKRGIGVHAKFTNSSLEIRRHFSNLWSNVTGGSTKYYPSRSGFNATKVVGCLQLSGANDWLRTIDMYNWDRKKRVPKVILNSRTSVMLAFLRGYNITDGLKSNLCTYEFKNFKTNSATLAMGLWYLVDKTTGQEINLTVETKEDGRLFYSLNILSTTNNLSKEESVRELAMTGISQREMSRKTGISRDFICKIQYGGSASVIHHMRRDDSEVKKIIEMPDYDGWFYDLETSSQEFHCGIGKIHVHNSPRRGETFVTRKITKAVARIKHGLQRKLFVGNLNARRDWGYAKDYVEVMWKMLQHKKADDYVIATGQTHTVKEFLEEAFGYVGLNYRKYVVVDKRYFRPLEVNVLRGNIQKARRILKWKPRVSFKELVQIMVDADMEDVARKMN